MPFMRTSQSAQQTCCSISCSASKSGSPRRRFPGEVMLELCCQSLQVQSFLQLWRLREACRTHDRLNVLLPFLQRFQIGQPNPRRGDFGMVSPIAAGPVFPAAVAPEGGAQHP